MLLMINKRKSIGSEIPSSVVAAQKKLMAYPEFYNKISAYRNCKNIDSVQLAAIKAMAEIRHIKWSFIYNYVLAFFNTTADKIETMDDYRPKRERKHSFEPIDFTGGLSWRRPSKIESGSK